MPSSLNRRRIETAIAALVAIAAGIVGIATREASRSLGPKFIKLDRIARLKEPVYLTQPPGQAHSSTSCRRQGTVRVLASDRLLPRPFLKISNLVKQTGGGADGGMTSIAFPPDYAQSGLFYVAYTDHRGQLVVARYSRSAANPLVADRSSAEAVLTIPESRPERHGGFITFGPGRPSVRRHRGRLGARGSRGRRAEPGAAAGQDPANQSLQPGQRRDLGVGARRSAQDLL